MTLERGTTLLLVLFGVVVFALLAQDLGRNDLIFGDEPLYALSALNLRHGVHYLANPAVQPLGPPGDKPFLYPVLLAASFLFGGRGETAPRLMTLALLLAAALPLYGIARAFWDARVAAFAALLFLASPLIANFGRWLRAEVPVTLAVVAAVWALTRASRGKPAGWGFAAGALLGLGFLCKLWLVAPGASALACGLVAHRLAVGPVAGPFVRRIVIATAAGFVAIAWSQILLCALVTPDTVSHWISVYFGFSLTKRLVGEGFVSSWHQPWHHYFVQAGRMLGLALPAIAAGCVAMTMAVRGRSDGRERLALGVLVGWLLPLVPMSIFSVKSGNYVLPILPALFLVAGFGLAALTRSDAVESLSPRQTRLAAGLALLFCAASQIEWTASAGPRLHSPGVAAVQAVWILVLFARPTPRRLAFAMCLALSVAAGLWRDFRITREAEMDIGYERLARLVEPALRATDTREVAFIAPAFPALSFYLFKTGRFWSVPYAGPEPEVAMNGLQSERPFFFVVKTPLDGLYGGAPSPAVLEAIESEGHRIEHGGPRGLVVYANESLWRSLHPGS